MSFSTPKSEENLVAATSSANQATLRANKRAPVGAASSQAHAPEAEDSRGSGCCCRSPRPCQRPPPAAPNRYRPGRRQPRAHTAGGRGQTPRRGGRAAHKGLRGLQRSGAEQTAPRLAAAPAPVAAISGSGATRRTEPGQEGAEGTRTTRQAPPAPLTPPRAGSPCPPAGYKRPG